MDRSCVLGRRDHQIKIRGYRVEPGEVESVLVRHSSVNEAVVTARSERDDWESNNESSSAILATSFSETTYLTAYIVASIHKELTTPLLRNYLRESLPEYMIPSFFVFLDKLPLSANGKVDRNSLPIPNKNNGRMERQMEAPRSPVEEALAELWTDFLHQEKVGIQENFFELGGHSLIATRLVSEIREIFQCELSLQSLFEHPTISGLAQEIVQISPASPDVQETAKLFLKVASLSDDEVDAMVSR